MSLYCFLVFGFRFEFGIMVWYYGIEAVQNFMTLGFWFKYTHMLHCCDDAIPNGYLILDLIASNVGFDNASYVKLMKVFRLFIV